MRSMNFSYISRNSLTGQHTLVDDAVSREQSGVAVHDAPMRRNHYNVSRNQKFSRQINLGTGSQYLRHV